MFRHGLKFDHAENPEHVVDRRLRRPARRLGVTVLEHDSADGYRGLIYGKLRIHSRPELTAWAILSGLVDARTVSRKRHKPSKKKPAKRRRRRCPACGRLI